MFWIIYAVSVFIVMFGILFAIVNEDYRQYTTFDDTRDYYILGVIACIPVLNAMQAFHVCKDLLVYGIDKFYDREPN